MRVRIAVGIAFAAVAAYALSFALDLFLGGWLGLYPSTVHVPVVVWTIIGYLTLIVAYYTGAGSRWLSLPFAALGGVATFGAIVGPHPHTFVVAGFLLLAAFVLWRVAQRSGNTGALHDKP